MYIYIYLYGIWYTLIYTMFMYYVYISSYLICGCIYVYTYYLERFDVIIQGHDDIQRVMHSIVWETIVSPLWTLESRSGWQRFVLQDPTDGPFDVRYFRIVC
jgi:hypothetical protein